MQDENSKKPYAVITAAACADGVRRRKNARIAHLRKQIKKMSKELKEKQKEIHRLKTQQKSWQSTTVIKELQELACMLGRRPPYT